MKVARYRPDIDGLRAVAIGLVLIFHFNLFSLGKAGFLGVDVFFVISGFLITGILIRQIQNNEFSYPKFLISRARRLFPAVYAVILFYLILGYFIFLPEKFKEISFESILSQFYVINIYFWRTINYFGLTAEQVPLLHMWSLAIEEQFYLLFPACCLLGYTMLGNRVIWLIAALCLSSFILGVLATPWKPEAAFYLLPTRAWELLLGSILALGALQRPPSGHWLLFMGPLGILLIMIAIMIHRPDFGVPGWFALLPCLGSAALILGGFNGNAPTTRLLSLPPLVWIGKISYPLYLVHWPVLITMKDLLPEFTLPWRLGSLVISVLLAWLIYVLIEQPIRQQRILVSRFVPTAFAATAVLTGMCLFVFSSGGMPQRYSPEVNGILVHASDTAIRFRHCKPLKDQEPCTLGDASAEPDLMILGDSHANALAEALDLWLARSGRAAHFSFLEGCLPVPGIGGRECRRAIQAAFDHATATSDIKQVMLVSIWRQPYGSGILYKGQWHGEEAAREIFSTAFLQTIEDLQKQGRQTILLEPLFSALRPVPETLAKNLIFGRNWSVDQPREMHNAFFQHLFGLFDQAENLGARRISLIDALCETGICRATLDGEPLFSDNNHVTSAVAPYFAEVLEEQMK